MNTITQEMPARGTHVPQDIVFAPVTSASVLADEALRQWTCAADVATGIHRALFRTLEMQMNGDGEAPEASSAPASGPQAAPYAPSTPYALGALVLLESLGLAMGSLKACMAFAEMSGEAIAAALEKAYGDPVEYLEDLQARLTADTELEMEELLHARRE